MSTIGKILSWGHDGLRHRATDGASSGALTGALTNAISLIAQNATATGDYIYHGSTTTAGTLSTVLHDITTATYPNWATQQPTPLLHQLNQQQQLQNEFVYGQITPQQHQANLYVTNDELTRAMRDAYANARVS